MKVSVLIPTFNSGKTLPYTLESLRMQTHRDFEILVCDGGSTDDALEIAKSYGAKIVGLDVRNIALARNILLEKATGDILIFIDSDVIAPPWFIEAHVEAHYKYLEIDILSSNIVIVNEPPDLESLRKLVKPDNLWIEPARSMKDFWQMASSLKRRVITKVKYDTDFSRAHEDGYFFYAALKAGLKIYKTLDIFAYHYKPARKKTLREELAKSFRNASFPLFLEKFGLWYLKANPDHATKFLSRQAMIVSIVASATFISIAVFYPLLCC